MSQIVRTNDSLHLNLDYFNSNGEGDAAYQPTERDLAVRQAPFVHELGAAREAIGFTPETGITFDEYGRYADMDRNVVREEEVTQDKEGNLIRISDKAPIQVIRLVSYKDPEGKKHHLGTDLMNRGMSKRDADSVEDIVPAGAKFNYVGFLEYARQLHELSRYPDTAE